ncbi:hypothetical protein D9M71_496990 [compost metagenome]
MLGLAHQRQAPLPGFAAVGPCTGVQQGQGSDPAWSLAHDLQSHIATKREPYQDEVLLRRLMQHIVGHLDDGVRECQIGYRDMRQLAQRRDLVLPQTGIAQEPWQEKKVWLVHGSTSVAREAWRQGARSMAPTLHLHGTWHRSLAHRTWVELESAQTRTNPRLRLKPPPSCTVLVREYEHAQLPAQRLGLLPAPRPGRKHPGPTAAQRPAQRAVADNRCQ